MHRDADFGIAFETANPRPVARAGIHDHDRRLGGIETVLQALVAGAGDAQQGIVDRPLEAAGVEDELMIEVEQRRLPCPLMRDHIVCALPQRVPEQEGALEGVPLIGQDIIQRQRAG